MKVSEVTLWSFDYSYEMNLCIASQIFSLENGP